MSRSRATSATRARGQAAARNARTSGSDPNRVGAVTNEKKTTPPIQTTSPRRWTNRSVAVTPGPPASRLALGRDPLVRGSLHRGTLGRPPEGELLDLPRQGEVPLGDAGRRVGLQLDPDLAPGDLEVGVMVGRL